MSRSRRISGVLAYLLLAFAARGTAEIQVQIEAPPQYRAAALRLRNIPAQRLARVERIVGITSSTTIQVLLSDEAGPFAVGVPRWVSGYAVPERGAVVLIPSRTVSYPNDELEDVVIHEVAHVMIDRAAGFQPVPRWFHEGVAMLAATGWDLEDRTRLALAMISIGRVPFDQLERDFRGDEAAVSRAYAYAGAFVRDLARRRGPEVIGRIPARIAVGDSFEEAFQTATGEPLPGAEQAFWSRQTLWNRWMPLLTSSIALWIAVTFLALLAGAARRRRDKRIMEQWGEDEENF